MKLEVVHNRSAEVLFGDQAHVGTYLSTQIPLALPNTNATGGYHMRSLSIHLATVTKVKARTSKGRVGGNGNSRLADKAFIAPRNHDHH